MNRRLLGVLVVVAFTLLAAVTAGAYAGRQADDHDADDVVLRQPGPWPRAGAQAALARTSRRATPGVKINLVFKDFNSLVGTVPRALASGSGPDVTEGNQGYQTDAQLVKAKLILPLTKYVKKYGWDKLYAPSTWGMFRWTPDGKSFGKGPVWGIAQTGQNVVAFYNKKKLRQPASTRTRCRRPLRGSTSCSRQLRAKLPDDEPVIQEGNKEGYGFIHLFGGIWGAYRQAADRPELDLPRARLALRHAGDDQGAREAPAVGQGGLLQRRLQRARVRRLRQRSSRRARACSGSGGDWDSTIIKTGLGAANVGVMPVPPGPSGTWTSIGGLSGPWHISAKTKYPDLGAEWLNYVITSPRAKALMYSQQQIPSDRRAKAPAGDPYLAQVGKAFQQVANDDGLLLYTDWASPSMYTTLQNQFQLLLAGRQTPAGMAKAVQDDWAKFDKTLR